MIDKAGGMIPWEAVPYAICYVITKDGKVEGFTTGTSCTYAEGSEYSIQAANEYGGPGRAGKADGTQTGIDGVGTDENMTVTGVYSADGVKLGAPGRGINIVVYTTSDGNTVTRKTVK